LHHSYEQWYYIIMHRAKSTYKFHHNNNLYSFRDTAADAWRDISSDIIYRIHTYMHRGWNSHYWPRDVIVATTAAYDRSYNIMTVVTKSRRYCVGYRCSWLLQGRCVNEKPSQTPWKACGKAIVPSKTAMLILLWCLIYFSAWTEMKTADIVRFQRDENILLLWTNSLHFSIRM